MIYILTKMRGIITAFLMENQHPIEIRCYESTSLIGNIYVGRVSNILRNMNAAFVDIAPGESCYLPLEDYHGEKKLRIGDLVTVQVTKDKIKTKQAAVTTNISLSGDNVVVSLGVTKGVSSKIKDNAVRERLKRLFGDVIEAFDAQKKCPSNSYGGIIRTAAEHVESDSVKKETVTLLCKLDDLLYRAQYATAYSCMKKNCPGYIQDMQEMQKNGIRIITDMQEYMDEACAYGLTKPEMYTDKMIGMSASYRLDHVLDKALSKRVYLNSGAYLVIEVTEAMTVIDVNSGKSIRGTNYEEAQYKVNVEAAHEIAKQLRLRNLSGIVIVDFISMRSSERDRMLLDELKAAVLSDPVPVNVVDITRLGLVEMTRKKVRKPLHELFLT